MDVLFEKAVKEVVACEKKASGFWGALVVYARQPSLVVLNVEGLKKAFQEQEQQATSSLKGRAIGTIGAYRSAKSVILQAVEKGVALLDSQEKPRGKTDVEKELKALKEEKPTIDRIKDALARADKAVDVFEGELSEWGTVLTLVSDLQKKVAMGYQALQESLPE